MSVFGPARLTLVLALLSLTPACAALGGLGANQVTSTPVQRFEPAGPRAFQAATAAAQLHGVVVTAADRGAVVSLTVTARAATLLAGAMLSADASAPCTAGVSAHAITLDTQRRWDRPLGLEGTRAVGLAFSDAAPLLSEPGAVVDLRLMGASGGHCLRVPLGSAADETAMLPASPWSVGGSLRTTFTTGPGLSHFLGGAMGAGYWFSRGLLGVEAGLALPTCAGPCGTELQYQIPLWLLAEAIPLRVRGFGLGVALAYGLIPGIRRRDSDPALVMHGPRVALQLLEVTPPLAATSRAQASARGLELSLSYQRAWLGPAPPVLIFGVGVVAF